MQVQDYIRDALRSESPLQKVVGDRAFIGLVVDALISAGKVADLLKKQVVYGKPITAQQWNAALGQLAWDTYHAGTAVGQRHESTEVPIHPRLFHAALGAMGEQSEMLEALLNACEEGTKLDVINVAEECGDSMWYLALMLDAIDTMGIAPDAVLQANVDKLKARYPDKFTLERSEGRDVDAERTVLETATRSAA